jgi:CMP-N-acetylneuraminic acid synthetase
MNAAVTPEVVALVPMRHHSVRVQGKNYRDLCGSPLYHYVVRTLLACPSVSGIVIDTDSPTIAEDCRRNFPSVWILDRPAHLRADDVPMNEVIVHDASQVPSELYLQTHSTNPFLTSSTIERALAFWRENAARYDSVFSATRIQARLWNDAGRPINHDPAVLLRTQDLAPIFLENSAFYLFSASLLERTRRRIGERPAMFEVDLLESIDIDDEATFRMAEAMMRVRVTATA